MENKKEQMIHEIKEKIRQDGALTCVDLESLFAKYDVPKGAYHWRHPQNRRLIYWTGLSKEGLEILRELMLDQDVKIYRESKKSYLCQGLILNLPTEPKQPDTYVWCPVGFAPGEWIKQAV